MVINKIQRKLINASAVIRNDGFIAFSIKSLQKLQSNPNTPNQKNKIDFLVKYNDALKADWSAQPIVQIPTKDKKYYTFNWIMSPPGYGSGGHQNIFRFIRYLELAGHKCRIYLYSNHDLRTVAEIKELTKNSYPVIEAEIHWLKGEMKPADGIFATGWETAYPAFNSSLKSVRYYFVQDFEPYFYPVGSEYVLAENTYRFGFYGITAGGWLAKKLHEDYGMETGHFDFGADFSIYKNFNNSKRNEVFFYARPVTARRGFELGIMALSIFHKQNPDYKINLAGWDVSGYSVPFPYNNLQTLPIEKLPALYNKCAVALVISLTNMSLLPLELLACGTIPIMNKGENNSLVSNNEYISYVDNNPASLAKGLSDMAKRDDILQYSKQASRSVESLSWEISGDRFVNLVTERLKNG